MSEKHLENGAVDRRRFIQNSALLAAAPLAPSVLGLSAGAFAGASDTIKVGLVGCGGRGTGAAAQALQANPNNVLWALADAFEDKIGGSLGNLEKAVAGMGEGHGNHQINVPEDRRFSGFDAFQKLIDSGVDVVLLATPPYFRPAQLAAAIDAGKHVFTEKPMAVDGEGVRSVLASAKKAKEKNLSLVAGYCWRFKQNDRDFIAAVKDGKMGEVRAVYTDYLTGILRSTPRKENWTDIEFQMRNWQHFTWLSGDHIAEQAVHSIDKINWIMGDVAPTRAVAVGGRQARANVPETGNVYDHFGVLFEYANGARAFHLARQSTGCFGRNTDYVLGSKGTADVNSWGPTHEIKNLDGKSVWRGKRRHLNNMYQQEHDELFAAIRNSEPVNDGAWMAQSTLMAIMAREAAYTGGAVTYKDALATRIAEQPSSLSWDVKVPESKVAIPGKSKAR